MARFRRPLLVPLLAVLFAAPLALPARGEEPSLAAALHGEHWAEAQAEAERIADPVVARLVAWLRLTARAPGATSTGTSSGAARAGEIAAFMTQNPDWPGQALLARRRDEAIAAEPDAALAAAECARSAPFAVHLPSALLHCAEAEATLGDAEAAASYARRAWIEGPADAAWEARSLARWGSVLDADTQRARFDRLAWSNPAAAQRQAARLVPAEQPRVQAWLALRQDAANAPALVAALPEAGRADPLLVLEGARWLRRAGQTDAAVAFWASSGRLAEVAASPAQQAAFWAERNLLARQMLQAGDAESAFAVADGFAGTGGEARLDADFLAAFLALRRLDRPDLAEPHLHALLALSHAAITQARGHYWLGRAAQAQGDAGTAQAEYTAAAAFPATYYGQLAALALDRTPQELIRAAAAPPADPARALDLAGQDLARAAAWLVAWGEAGWAQSFLLRLDEELPDTADRVLTARLALGLGLPQTAVAISRHAGSDGMTLLPQGWPVAASIPGSNTEVEPALVLGVIRQESSFDSNETSPAGARGLMQLMPATAAEMAKKLGLRLGPTTLTADPQTNITLGAAYLAGLLARYQSSVPLAVAAYNAGPGRVAGWLAGYGDPRKNGDMIDWIEEIPISETRNYVQRVIENQEIYRAELDDATPHPLAAWAH